MERGGCQTCEGAPIPDVAHQKVVIDDVADWWGLEVSPRREVLVLVDSRYD